MSSRRAKKGRAARQEQDDEEFALPAENSTLAEDTMDTGDALAFTGKKKGKNKKSGKPFAILEVDVDTALDSPNEVALRNVADDSQSLEEEDQVQFTGKKKGKKGKKQGKVFEDADFEAEFPAQFEDDSHSFEEEQFHFTGKKKGKKGKKKDEDADFEAEFPSQIVDNSKLAEEETQVQFTGKKKGKKGRQQDKDSDDADFEVIEADNGLGTGDGDDTEDATVSGVIKGQSRKSGKAFLLLDEDGNLVEDSAKEGASTTAVQVGDEEEEQLQFLGKKKGKKGKKLGDSFKDEDFEANVADSNGVEAKADDANDSPAVEDAITFLGKKKDKNKEAGKLPSLLDETAVDSSDKGALLTTQSGEAPSEVGGDGVQSFVAAEEDEVQFTGKKKGKKGKKADKVLDGADIDAIMAERDAPQPSQSGLDEATSCDAPPPPRLDEVVTAPTSKKSKKGKKSGRSAQEEEDLDAILAELDGPKPVHQSEATYTVEPPEGVVVQAQQETLAAPAEGLIDAEGGESAAAKKKKKKKEKEKAKALTSSKPGDQVDTEAPPEDKQEGPRSKVPEKKVPKHVREMQERLARQKEAEERLRREEEERRRKEEEELRRLEELEKEKEEAKRRRKEREKEKLLKKKQEGKLLTGKQKEEARRLALMREQLLAQKGVPADPDVSVKEEIGVKKPKYESKKKRRPQGGEAALLAEQPVEENNVQSVDEPQMEIEAAVVVEEPEVEPDVEVVEEAVVEVEEEDEDEDWDAKSWDDDKIELPAIRSAFAEEEELNANSKRVLRRLVSQSSQDAIPISAKMPMSPQKAATQKPTAAQVNSKAQESEVETESEDETESEEEDVGTRRRKEVALKREARKAEALSKRSADDLRSPICCILGHVDTGKTKLLDCIRRTNVQEGEAGGITQQIGATYFPMENIKERTKELKSDAAVRVPGLLVIDTPGHESFTNLRSRGSGLCDIAILVVDIMHGLEPQTLESLNLLKMRHTPFVVALNKVDRLYGWKTFSNAPIRAALKQQSKDVVNEFETRLNQIVTELKEQGMNSELYYKNKELRKVVSIVPTSAISGEGVPDLLMLLVHLTQKVMEDKLMYISEVQCTVLEVKVIEGLGTTIDVILVNGVLHEGDQIVVCGMQGPIVTNIRALLTPHPMKELRIKGSYQHHKELKAAQGIKITAQGLEHAIAGTQLYVVGPEDDLEEVKTEAMQDMKNVMNRVDKSGEGVCVQASTLGSLEALLEFLKSPAVKIPVSGINIGPVHKRDVMRASVMLERKKKEYATILAFDVKVTPEAKELAEELGVRIFMADIIYHLFDQFTAYLNNIKEEKRKEVAEEAVFPCVLGIKPQFVFNKKDPIILGVDVLEGIAKVGTPLCVPSQDMILIGRIASMEVNHKVVDSAKKGQAVAMKIVGSTPEETQKMFGRHFDHEDELVSHITRRSIDVLKESFRDELSVEEWKLVVKLKKLFNIS